MATYIQGLTDYIPKAEPYKPNFDFLNTVLATRQARYDSSLNQLSGAYGSIVYADLTRDDNRVARDNFLKNSEKAIQQITSLDLSDPANVQLAQQVFQPFVDDKRMQYDILLTKGANKAKKQADLFKNSGDPDIASKYWDTGVRAIDYKLLEFKNADQEKAYKMAIPKYTPYINILKEAKDLLGDDFNISVDEKMGGYIVTTKNGDKAINAIHQYLDATLSTDPRVREYASTLAYVSSMDDIMNLSQNYNGDINEAKAQYYIGKSSSLIDNVDSKIEDYTHEMAGINSKLLMYESRIDRGGQLTDKEQKDFQKLTAEKAVYDNALNSLDANKGSLITALETNDISQLERYSQSLLAQSRITDEIAKATQFNAYRNYERSMKADPYEKSQFDAALDFSYWTKKKSMEWAREDAQKALEKAEKEAKEAAGSELMSTRVQTEAGKVDSWNNDLSSRDNSLGGYHNSVKDVINTISDLGASDPKIKQALDNALKSTGLSYNNIMSGNYNSIGVSNLNKINNALVSMIKADPNIYKSLGSLVSQMNTKKQVAYSNAGQLQKNNNVTVMNLMRSTNLSANEKMILREMFTKDGALLSAKSAYDKAKTKIGRNDLDFGDFFRFDDFKDMYDDLLTKFSSGYNEQASNNNPLYKPVGMLGVGGGGTMVDYATSGVADPTKQKSRSYLAFKELLDDAGNPGSVVALGSPAELREASEGNIGAITNDPYLKTYVDGLKVTMLANKKPVTFSYSLSGLGSTKYNALNIKPNAEDPALKALKEGNKELYNNIIQKGITIFTPAAAARNRIAKGAALSDAEIILNTNGSYVYDNPRVGTITFRKLSDNNYSASGFLNSGNKQEPVNMTGIDIIKLNSIVNTFNTL
jgi:hypothetical protein